MKNVKENQLKKCIFKGYDEFKKDVAVALGENVTVECDYEGISFDYDGNVLDCISKYYGVEVTSIHIDDCDYIGVWIVYK